MKVAVSMICLNEENYIRRALDSCVFADHICIVDGCSTDRTEDVIAQFHQENSADGITMELKTIPWDAHFGKQRQRALQMVPEDVDWWMRIDSDERYSDEFVMGVRLMLEGLTSDILAVRIRQTNLYPDEDHYAASHGGWETWPRIFRHIKSPDGISTALRWAGQVHEHCMWMTSRGQIDFPESRIADWNAQVYHYGWLEKARREEREDLYATIPGSGVSQRGDLIDREYVIRALPVGGSL